MPDIRRALALESAVLTLPRALIDRGGRGLYRLPILSAALELDDGTWVLVDGGLGPALGLVRRYLPWAARAASLRPVIDTLARLGVEPRAVRAILVTHLDYDHTGALADLPESPVLLSRKEHRHALAVLDGPVANAFAPGRLLEWAMGRQRAAEVRAPRTVRELEPRPAPDADAPAALARSSPAFDDIPIRIIDLPGHTPGHAGFHVKLAGGREILFAGDAAFNDVQLRGEAEPGAFPMAVAWSRPRYLETLGKLRDLALARPALQIIASHDEALGRRCARDRGAAEL